MIPDKMKYLNIKGRISNDPATLNIYEKHDFFVAEQDGFIIPSDENPETFLEEMETYLKERNHFKEINFAGIPKSQFNQLASKFKVVWEEFCWLFLYDTIGVDNLSNKLQVDGLEVRLDHLREDDIQQVFEYYTYKDDGIGYIEDVVKKQITLCARVDDKLVSWVVQRGDGSMGIMYTLKEYRRKGIGEWLSKHLINRILEKGEIPYLHIVVENAPSIALAESLGFKRHSEIVWFGIENPFYKFRRDVILNAHEVSTLFSKHLEAMDDGLKEMIKLDFNHDSIHAYRESIRLFRALLYFYKPAMRPGDYRFLDMQSKKYFDKTSLIREIEVFEAGYLDCMSAETIEHLNNLKQPLLARLKLDTRRMVSFKFSNSYVKLPYLNPDSMKSFEMDRQCELFDEFIRVDKTLLDYQEKYIHTKRMLSKKIKYIHEIIMNEDESLHKMNAQLGAFQVVAKNLHDTCVNLRIVGSYKLDDPGLIEKLVEDHAKYTGESSVAYDLLVQDMKAYMEK